jgi:hypothetical protein
MKIATISAIGEYTIKSRFSRLEMVVNLGAVTTPVLMGNVLTELNLMTAELTRTSKDGTENIFQKVPLGHLFILSILNDGIISSYVSGGNTYVRCIVEIANDGAIVVQNNDQYTLIVAGTMGNNTIDVYALDLPVDSRIVNFIDRTVLDANATQEITTTNATWIAVPKADVNRIELSYSSGRRAQYEKEEQVALMRDAMGIVAIDQGLSISGQDLPLLFIPVANVTSVKIDTSAASTVYKLTPKYIN